MLSYRFKPVTLFVIAFGYKWIKCSVDHVGVTQVSHHPSISAAHCESSNFILWQGNIGTDTSIMGC